MKQIIVLIRNISEILKMGKEMEKAGNLRMDGRIIFFGEYLNGERWKGKEYDNDYNPKVKFDGEWFQGKWWNGKGYDANGNIIFELKNGKGFVKEYYILSKKIILFEGRYSNGERNGKGKEFFNNTIYYEGEFVNGKKQGKGKEYNLFEELVFECEFYYDQRKKGKEYNKGKLIYEGEFLFDKKWNGKVYEQNGEIIYFIISGNKIEK